MKLTFLFLRPGVTVTLVAEAAEVDMGTASRWKSGERPAKWPHICKLYARGLLSDEDLRAAGLAIPRSASPATSDVPKSAVG